MSATVFLLSPANLSGKRGQMLMRAEARFELALRLRSAEGASIAELFSFVSGLYFRGKVAYARAFGAAPHGVRSAYVMTAGGGLYELDRCVTLARLQEWKSVSVSEHNPHFTAPLLRQCSEVLDVAGADTRFVLLGSVARDKYVAPLLEVFDDKLLFPERFAGLGDMSRGSLMLRAARDAQELTYAPLRGLRRDR